MESTDLPISFGNQTFTKFKDIAAQFTKQFTSVVPHSSNPNARKIWRSIKKRHLTDEDAPTFTAEAVKSAIQGGGNSKAAGPDHLTILHLKHLGPSGLNYLTQIFNLSIRYSSIPAIRKSAIFIPILKAGKPDTQDSSYRPISLLSPTAKILERLLLPYLTAALHTNHTQHGFKKLHSTTTALLPLSSSIATGFNQQKPAHRTAIVTIDFSKAFDIIDHSLLLQKVNNTTLHANIVRWLTCYLRGRSSACLYQGATACSRVNHTGVPQGSVISPCLFNFFVADCPTDAHIISSYADDLTVGASSPDVQNLELQLGASYAPIEDWAAANKMVINQTKSHITLFTPWTHQFHLCPYVSICNEPASLDQSPKILGITFDTMFTFSAHCNKIHTRASNRLSILKALASTSWGHSKETIMLTYKSLIEPILTYGSPVWSPNASPTSLTKLQTIQYAALRIATGAVKMSSLQHLHSEASTLPLADKLQLLNTQFLTSALRPDHPFHELVTADSGPRCMKHTLQSKYLDFLTRHLDAMMDLLTQTNTALQSRQSTQIQSIAP